MGWLGQQHDSDMGCVRNEIGGMAGGEVQLAGFRQVRSDFTCLQLSMAVRLEFQRRVSVPWDG